MGGASDEVGGARDAQSWASEVGMAGNELGRVCTGRGEIVVQQRVYSGGGGVLVEWEEGRMGRRGRGMGGGRGGATSLRVRWRSELWCPH